MSRGQGFFISATDTDVGKTFVAAGLAAVIRKRFAAKNGQDGGKVSVWKPVQSGAEMGSPEADSYRLVMGGGLTQTEAETATFTFPEPLAPWLAAEYAGAAVDFDRLVQEGLRRLQASDCLLVEGAGGLMVPLTDRHMIVDLASALRLPLIIIARPTLGTVNHTLLSIHAARAKGLEVRGVILNGCKAGLEKRVQENAMMIETFSGVPVLGKLPWFELDTNESPGASNAANSAGAWAVWRERWTAILEQQVDIDSLLSPT